MHRAHDPRLAEIDLNLLASLEVLIRHRSVTKAAEELELSQSATSHRLNRLREQLGDRLLVAGEDGMTPTPKALEMAAFIQRGLAEMSSALRVEQKFTPETSERTYTIACADYGDLVFLPRMINRLRALAPNSSVIFTRMGTTPISALESGEFDICVCLEGQIEAANLRKRVVLDGGCDSGVCAEHPGVGEQLDLDTYLGLQHLLISPSAHGPGLVDHALAELGQTRRVAARVNSFATAPFLLPGSDLVLTAPRGILQAASRLVPLRLFRPPVPLPDLRVVMLWHERWHDDPGHQFIRNQTLEIMTVLRDHLARTADLPKGAALPAIDWPALDAAWAG